MPHILMLLHSPHNMIVYSKQSVHQRFSQDWASVNREAVEKSRKVRNDLLSGWSVWNEAGPRRKSEDIEMIKSRIERQPFV